MAIVIVVVEMVLVCKVRLQDHVTKASSKIIGRSPSRLVTILPIHMYLLHKFGGHRFYGNEDTYSHINFYMNSSEKAELTASVRHIEGFTKSGILYYDSENPGTANWKTRIRTLAIANRYALYKKATNQVKTSK